MTSSHIIFKIKPPITSRIMSICPLHNGYKVLVGSWDRIVRMWDVNLARNQAITMNTQDDVWEVITVLPFRNIVATKSKQSIEFQNIVTLEVIRYIDSKSGIKIVFSPDENWIAVLSNSLIL